MLIGASSTGSVAKPVFLTKGWILFYRKKKNSSFLQKRGVAPPTLQLATDFVLGSIDEVHLKLYQKNNAQRLLKKSHHQGLY